MFRKTGKTIYPPNEPTMVWDGKCGFCRYWVTYWQSITGEKVVYLPFQQVEDKQFQDIPVRDFKEAARLIDPSGKVYDGPAAAYKSLEMAGKYTWMLRWYETSAVFRVISDYGYQWIADHREFSFRATHLFFGKNPNNPRSFWLYYILCLIALAALAIVLS